MKRHYLFAFAAGYLVSNLLVASYIRKIREDNARIRDSHKRLHDMGTAMLAVVEEKNPELLEDPRIHKFIFENIVKDL